MKTIIRPMRKVRGQWVPCTFALAMRHDIVCQRTGKTLARRNTLTEAKAVAEFWRRLGRNRTKDQMLGARYSTVREEVTTRSGDVLYTSSKSPRNSEANERNSK